MAKPILNASRVMADVGQGVAAGVAEQDLPEQWVNAAKSVLLGALRRWAPHSISWTKMQDLVPVLDAFEAHTECKTSRRH